MNKNLCMKAATMIYADREKLLQALINTWATRLDMPRKRFVSKLPLTPKGLTSESPTTAKGFPNRYYPSFLSGLRKERTARRGSASPFPAPSLRGVVAAFRPITSRAAVRRLFCGFHRYK
nr:hypothetical protein [Paenibacillus alba]